MFHPARRNFAKPVTPKNVIACAVAIILCFLCFQLPSCSGATLSVLVPVPRVCQNLRQAVSAESIRRLQNYEVVVIIDKSRSMLIEDCPAANSVEQQDPLAQLAQSQVSRWQWCQEQLFAMARQAQEQLPEKFRVITFSGDYTIYDNVDPPGVNMIFAENHPSGPTIAAHALKDQLDSYLSRRAVSSRRPKPLLIAVITDGCPNDPAELKYEIAAATKKMQDPSEIAITILQVGHDNRATKLLSDFQQRRYGSTMKFDIVHCLSFDQLEKTGLVPALASSVGYSGSASNAPEIGM
ncbi:MAG TPA: hypothetical protein V6C69_12665 [Trichormus sp.]|jgi:hypothetical protein